MTQGDGALDTGADVEQSVIGGGNDSRLHSGYEAESGEDCNVNSPIGVEKDTTVVLQDVGTTGAESAPCGSMDGGWRSSTVRYRREQAIRRVYRVMKRPWQNRS